MPRGGVVTFQQCFMVSWSVLNCISWNDTSLRPRIAVNFVSTTQCQVTIQACLLVAYPIGSGEFQWQHIEITYVKLEKSTSSSSS